MNNQKIIKDIPELELETQAPVKTRFNTFIKQGNNDYGFWALFLVEVDNQDKKMFIYDETLAEQLQSCGKGKTLTFESYLTKSEKGKPVEKLKVHELNGAAPQETEIPVPPEPQLPSQDIFGMDFDFAGLYAETYLELENGFEGLGIQPNENFSKSVTSVFIAKRDSGMVRPLNQNTAFLLAAKKLLLDVDDPEKQKRILKGIQKVINGA